MDVYRVSNDNQMDYNVDERVSKHGKMIPSQEDRFDSGLDSLKDDEYGNLVKELEDLRVAPVEVMSNSCSNEPWRKTVTEDRDTFLHLAIIHEATEHAEHMIKLSHNDDLFLDAQNNQRQTALHLAVITEQPHLVERLLKAGCDPRIADDSGNTALHIACKKGSLTSFSVITQNCPRHLRSILTFPNYSGHNCLHLASINGYLSMVESLVQLGADINAQEHCSGRTALHLAVDLQNPSLVHRLLSMGADVNSVTYGGYTPFHLTYGRQNAEIHHQLYEKTAQELRELPESESEESEEECLSGDEQMYDDITFGQN
ncbi:NF-kappa-B inhibitor alpha-like [Salvelinus fontinalis]|uniref:NF-kappa-B inhibitor alpha n=1 Tax=Salvelinus namaycush TaxID=8040 RepID=A0A8U0PI64_SALNM|nr:NF-kappa-B inhibitor alpha-like [Salvelinus namaycush]XP_055729070.1 NF-kappa-B inhibitor alpha-like [Salvelinus fontinalis]